MKNCNKTLKMTAITLAIMLATAAGANAQTITLNDGDHRTTDIVSGFPGGITVHVPSGVATVSGNIWCNQSYAQPFVKTGNGRLIVMGIIFYASNIAVQGGFLQLGDGVTFGGTSASVPTFSIAYGTALRIETADANFIIANVISGSGHLQFKAGGSGNLYLNANNTFTGPTFIEAGNLYLGGGGATGAIDGNIDVSSGAALYFVRAGSYT